MQKIFTSVIILSVATIASACLKIATTFILTYIAIQPDVDFAVYDGIAIGSDYLWSAIMLVAFVGYIIYWVNLKRMRSALPMPYKAGFGKIMTGVVLFSAGIFIVVIPASLFVGANEYIIKGYEISIVIAAAIEMLGLSYMISGFSKLATMSSASMMMRQGFSMLKLAAIVLTVGMGLSLTLTCAQTFIIKLHEMVSVYTVMQMVNTFGIQPIKLVGMVVLIVGWAKVKNASISEERNTEFQGAI